MLRLDLDFVVLAFAMWVSFGSGRQHRAAPTTHSPADCQTGHKRRLIAAIHYSTNARFGTQVESQLTIKLMPLRESVPDSVRFQQ